MKKASLHSLVTTLLTLALATIVRADRIELADGSVINGKLLSAEGGKLKVETAFAGTIEIVQAEVKTFSTDEAVNVSLAGGSAALGKVAATEAGIKVASAHGEISAATTGVDAVWRQGEDSPETKKHKAEIEAKTRKWAYEASVAIAGRTGATEKFGAAFGFKATLASAQDKLIFALAADRAKDNGVTTADRQFGGVDYSSFYSPDNGWYVRSSLEKDKIKNLDLRSSSGFGFGRKLIKNKQQDLEFRLGAGYRYDSYTNGTTFDSPGLDIGFLNTYNFANAKLTDAVGYTPAFKDFTNYRIRHESAFELPIAASLWKLKLGIANEYFSVPPPGTERLDTTYFTSLILNWK